MRIFITGASGFVGGAATRSLIEAGHQVSAMSRSESSDTLIRDLGAEPIRCDLETVTAEHVGDAEIVLHSAAFVEAWGPKDAWHRYNVLGTQAMLTAGREAGARRFIHIGTEAAICHGQHVRDADETVPLAPDSPYPYCATKAQAEQLVRDANSDGTFETIILRPRFIWGPGDTTLLPLIEEMAKSGKWMWINDGKAMTSTTHIANLVHAIDLALTKGGGGEAYFILDEGTISVKDMIGSMAQARGLTLSDKSISSGLADFVGRASEKIWRILHLKNDPPLTAHAAMVMSRDCTLNGDKAASDLGYKSVVTRAEGFATL
ncbi:NAD-dependent epimerase/dehydratase family protein [Sphingorhabdus sp. Alg231-15]|uniref:NAD-dependent epimerase/dehydratase family protein n=1 Tax=Sphingorhabdus sp. Alg231-15 TaxID=1922222 RepID=UPI000D55D997